MEEQLPDRPTKDGRNYTSSPDKRLAYGSSTLLGLIVIHDFMGDNGIPIDVPEERPRDKLLNVLSTPRTHPFDLVQPHSRSL
jgi:hypothetical protein